MIMIMLVMKMMMIGIMMVFMLVVGELASALNNTLILIKQGS